MVSLQGVQIISAIIQIVGFGYITLLALSFLGVINYLKVVEKKKKRVIGVTTKGKWHLVVACIFLVFAVFKPIKFAPQTDAHKAQIRHSFDTKIYESNTSFTEAAKSGGYNVAEEVKESKSKWDKTRSE